MEKGIRKDRVCKMKINNMNLNIDAETIVLNTFGEEAHYILNSVLLYTYGLEQSFFLTYLMNQYRLYKKEERLRSDKSFYLTNQKISLYTTISEYKIQTLKKFAIENDLIQVVQEGMPSKTYYYINFEKILKIAMTDKTLSELAYLYAYEHHFTEEKTDFDIPLNNIEDIEVLKKETVKFLRLFCKQNGISYTGNDRKETLIQKIIEKKNPDLLNLEKSLESPFFTVDEKIDHQWTENSSTSEQEIRPLQENEGLNASSGRKNHPLVDEKTDTNQDINQDQKKNHDHEEHDLDLDFEKIFHELGVNYTKMNQESIERLLQKMKPYEVERYIRELYKNIKENPEVKNANALFCVKIQRQECQINTVKQEKPKKIETVENHKKNYTREEIRKELQKYNTLEQKNLFEKVKEEFSKTTTEEEAKYMFDYIEDDILGNSLTYLRKEWIKVLFIEEDRKKKGVE